MSFHNIHLHRDGALATLTIDRPAALNALDMATLDEIDAAIADVGADRTVRCLLVTGAGSKAFVAGADIAAMERMTAVEARAFSRRGQAVLRRLEELPIPVVAVVNGFALGGGCELALACDLIFASETARFGQPEINLGIIPGFGGTQRLARRIGLGRTRELIYSGAMVDAAEGLRLGLVDRVVAPDQLIEQARAFAASLAEKAPIALRQAKAAVNVGTDVDLASGCAYEAEGFGVAFASEDRREGMQAFLQKRRPTFKGE